MKNSNKGKAKIIFSGLSLPFIIIFLYHFTSFANYPFKNFSIKYTNVAIDTPPIQKAALDTSKINKTIKPANGIKLPSFGEEKVKQLDTPKVKQNIDTIVYKKSGDALAAPVTYHADDSAVIDVPAEKMYLYGKTSSIIYEDNNLSAPKIEFDNKTNIVSAFLVKDSTGKAISYPYYNQGDMQTVSDTIKVNMKNGKGLTKGTYTKQGDFFLYSDKFKKIDTSVFYASLTRFTTCNLDTPHFAFISKKAKFINKKWAFTGPVHPEFEGVPLPFSLPFGIFPLSQGMHSGLLAPTFNTDVQRGLGLDNFGYYKIFNEYIDLETRASFYSYGTWNLSLRPKYYKRYHYTGGLNFSVISTKLLDEKRNNAYNITWNHSIDNKARPGVTFRANVNAGSTQYNSVITNNVVANFNNSLFSTISYQKVWKNKPYNLSVNANHNQNSVSKNTTIEFPSLSFSVNTQYPFRKKEPIGESKWYENIGIGYSGAALSRSSFNDTLGSSIKQLSDNIKYGATHQIPISLSLPPLGIFQISPGVSFDATFYQQKLIKTYNVVTQKTDTVSLQKGLFAASQIGFTIGASTRIFGMFGFNKNSRVKAIRHEVRPQLSLNYRPDINNWNYYNTRVSNTEFAKVSTFEGNINSAYSNQKSGGIGFNLDNIVTMKVKSKTDTSAKSDTKITLLDGLSLSTNYNLLADSLKLSKISLSARTNLFGKVNVSASATTDPYEVNSLGRNINTLVWKKKPFSLGRLENASISLQTSFKGGDKAKNKEKNKTTKKTEGITEDQYRQEEAYIRSNPAEFADFEIPWSIDLSYSFSVSKIFDITTTKFNNSISQSVSFNASTNLTPKWKIGTNSTYDIKNKSLGQMATYITRDMHCWQMAINISPIGKYRYFSINISPKSPILRDLKINRTRTFTDF